MQAHAGFLAKNSDLPSHTSTGGIVGERDIRAAGDGDVGTRIAIDYLDRIISIIIDPRRCIRTP